MIKYRPTTFLPLLFPYLLLGVIPSQGAAINNNPSNGSLEISGNTVMYLPGKGSKKDEDLKDVVQKFNKNFPSEAQKEKREATIASIRNFPLPDFPLQIIDIINSYSEEIFHLDITKAGNLKILKYLNKYAKQHFTVFTCSLSNKSEATLLKRLPNVTRWNVKFMGNENIKNCVRSLLKLKLNLSTKSIELPESFEDNCPNEFTKLKNQGWKLNPEKNGQKIIPLIGSLKNRTVDEKKIIKRTIKQLIEEGANLNARGCYGDSSLEIAIVVNNLEIVTLLINNGADVITRNYEGDSPLDKAIIQNNLEIVTLLINNGADVNAINNKGRNSLYQAVFFGHEKMVTFLIEKRVDIDRKDTMGKGLLFLALLFSYLEIATLLVENGADVNEKDNKGDSLLHFAVLRNNLEMATFFMKNGANINAKNNDGYTPLQIARQRKNSAMINLFITNNRTTSSGWRYRRIIYFLLFRGVF